MFVCQEGGCGSGWERRGGEELRGLGEGKLYITYCMGKIHFQLKKRNIDPVLFFCTLCENFYRLSANNTATWTGCDPGSLKI